MPEDTSRPAEIDDLALSERQAPGGWVYTGGARSGRGGQGVVKRVHHARWPGILGALKVMRGKDELSEKARSRFQREAKILSDLRHAFVVPYLDHGVDPEPWLVTEWMPLGCCGDHLSTLKGDVWRVLRIGRDAATALGAAHGRGIVHRDVKPKNLLLRSMNEVRVGDFGIAYSRDDDRNTSADEAVGPRNFRAPEAEERVEDPGPPLDVYALGKTLYALLSGTPLAYPRERHRESEYDVVIKMGNPDLEPFNQLLDKMVVEQPGTRLQSMAEVVVEIDRCSRRILGPGTMPKPSSPRAAPRTELRLASTLERMGEVLDWGATPDDHAEAIKDVNEYARRVAQAGTSTRTVLAALAQLYAELRGWPMASELEERAGVERFLDILQTAQDRNLAWLDEDEGRVELVAPKPWPLVDNLVDFTIKTEVTTDDLWLNLRFDLLD